MKMDYLEYKIFYGTVHFSSGDAVFFGKISGVNYLIIFEGSATIYMRSHYITGKVKRKRNYRNKVTLPFSKIILP